MWSFEENDIPGYRAASGTLLIRLKLNHNGQKWEKIGKTGTPVLEIIVFFLCHRLTINHLGSGSKTRRAQRTILKERVREHRRENIFYIWRAIWNVRRSAFYFNGGATAIRFSFLLMKRRARKQWSVSLLDETFRVGLADHKKNKNQR